MSWLDIDISPALIAQQTVNQKVARNHKPGGDNLNLKNSDIIFLPDIIKTNSE